MYERTSYYSHGREFRGGYEGDSKAVGRGRSTRLRRDGTSEEREGIGGKGVQHLFYRAGQQ